MGYGDRESGTRDLDTDKDKGTRTWTQGGNVGVNTHINMDTGTLTCGYRYRGMDTLTLTW